MPIGDYERSVLKRIYEAAEEFAKGDVKLEEVTIYLIDQPVAPDSGMRIMQIENLEATAEALRRARWITTKDGNQAIEAHLTRLGISAARRL